MYHGPDRDKRVSSLSAFDVVLTTYNILAQEVGIKNGLLKVRLAMLYQFLSFM